MESNVTPVAAEFKSPPTLSESQITELLNSLIVTPYKGQMETPSGQIFFSPHIYDQVANAVGRENINHSIHMSVPVSDVLTDIVKEFGMIYGNYPATLNHHYLLQTTGSAFGPQLSITYQYILGGRRLGALTKEHMKILHDKMAEALMPSVYNNISIGLGRMSQLNDEIDKELNGIMQQLNPITSETTEPSPIAQSGEPMASISNDKIKGIIPALKDIVYTNEECTELKLLGQVADYATLKKVFENMGGKWHRGSGTHRFEESPMDRITDIIETGTFKAVDTNPYGYYPTPPELIRELIADLDYFEGMKILEPEIGQGHIADEVKAMYPDVEIIGYEINPKNAAVSGLKHTVHIADFLDVEPEPIYDAVIMNPPFEKQQDIKHIEHAMKFLKPGAPLVAIMSNSVTFRQDKRSLAFRELIESNGGIIVNNPEAAFKSSGTLVNTVSVKVSAAPSLRKSLRM